LEIGELDIYPKKTMEGIWVIDVCGRKGGSFTLTVSYEDKKIVNFRTRQPFSDCREDSTMYTLYKRDNSDLCSVPKDVLRK